MLDGRDIGTVICPDAPAKLFVTASAEARAKRRYDELIERGQDASLDQVLAEVKERDDRDMNRADAPLRPADDAMHLDTTELSIEEAVAEAIGDRGKAGVAGTYESMRCLTELIWWCRPADRCCKRRFCLLMRNAKLSVDDL